MLVLLNGPKLIACILFCLAKSKARLRASSTLLPASLEHSEKV